MRQKALFFDIDGTILSDITGKVPESAVKALDMAVKSGHLTFINTGRTLGHIPAMIKELPFVGYVCGCGTCITLHGEILMEYSIPHQRGREIIDIIRECDAVPVMEGKTDCYFPKERTRFAAAEYIREYFRKNGKGTSVYLEEDRFDYDKFIFFHDEKTDMKTLLENLGQDMDLMDRKNGVYEVAPKGFSKATGMEFIRRKFGMELDDIYVFGDSSNDLSMFQYAPHAVAMGSHDPILDPYAEFVTKTVEEDGIYYAMEHYGLL